MSVSKGTIRWRVRKRLEESQWWSADRLAGAGSALRDFLVDIGARSLLPGFVPASWLRPEVGRTIDDLSALPLLGKPDIRANVERLKADGHGPLTRYNTGGSSGEPLIFYMGRAARATTWRPSGAPRVGGTLTSAIVNWWSGGARSNSVRRTVFDVCATE
jgi:phenylacetate-CoA ligase